MTRIARHVHTTCSNIYRSDCASQPPSLHVISLSRVYKYLHIHKYSRPIQRQTRTQALARECAHTPTPSLKHTHIHTLYYTHTPFLSYTHARACTHTHSRRPSFHTLPRHSFPSLFSYSKAPSYRYLECLS